MSEEIRAKAEGFKSRIIQRASEWMADGETAFEKGGFWKNAGEISDDIRNQFLAAEKRWRQCSEEAERFEKNILELQKLEKCREALRSADVDAVQKQTALEGEVKTIRERLEEIRRNCGFIQRRSGVQAPHAGSLWAGSGNGTYGSSEASGRNPQQSAVKSGKA